MIFDFLNGVRIGVVLGIVIIGLGYFFLFRKTASKKKKS